MPYVMQLATATNLNVINGTNGPDNLVGTPNPDQINGLGDWDRISGLGGNDVLLGGDGVDALFGDAGDDRLFGGNDGDFLYGHDGRDWLSGENGADVLYGGSGDDRLWGGNGRDFANGQDGNDQIQGGADADFLAGGSGRDCLSGDDGNDVLWGGLGNDRLVGNNGNDDLQGGSGRDRLGGGAGADALRGGLGDDILSGGSQGDHLFGQRGNDWINGGDGTDRLYGDSGPEYAMQALIQLPAGESVAGLATDGETLVVTAPSGRMYFYDVDTQALTGSISTPTQFSFTADAAVSDGRILVGTAPFAPGRVTALPLYDTYGHLVQTLPNPIQGGTGGFGANIALDGHRAVVATDTDVYFYNANTGALRATFTLPPPSFGEGWYVSKAELSGNTAAIHASFATGGRPEYTFVLNADTGALRHRITPAGHDLDEAGTRDIDLNGDTLLITEPRDRASEMIVERVHQYQAHDGAFVRTLDPGQPPESLTPIDSRLVNGVQVDGRDILVGETVRIGTLGFHASPEHLLFDARNGTLVQRISDADSDPESEGSFALSHGVLAMTTASQGGAGAVTLYWRDRPADGGRDHLDGGVGDDVLTGGPGADVFVMGQNGGHDRIEDFHPAEGDRILVSGLGAHSAHDLAFAGTAAGVLVSSHGVSVELAGMDLAHLSASEFLFV
jgi:Ca2+-binding RTX toxin-like protein